MSIESGMAFERRNRGILHSLFMPMVRVVLKISLLALAFFAIAAPGGGGGGGGTGGGGSKSSFSSGSSGYSGSSSYRDDSDWRYRYRDDEPRWWWETHDLRALPIVIGMVVLAGGVLYVRDFFRKSGRRYWTSNWVLLLRDSERYARFFEETTRTHSFATPHQRLVAMNALTKAIRREDLIDATYFPHGSDWSGSSLGNSAEALYEKQSQLAEIDKGIERLDLPNRQVRQDDQTASTQSASAESNCIVGFILVARGRKAPRVGQGPQEALSSLYRSAVYPGEESFLFYYYTPRPGETLHPDEAKRLYRKVTNRA